MKRCAEYGFEIGTDNKTADETCCLCGGGDKGEPEIEVSFDIDSSGMVSVSARDLDTGTEQSITVNSTSTLTAEELEQIIADNEAGEVQFKS